MTTSTAFTNAHDEKGYENPYAANFKFLDESCVEKWVHASYVPLEVTVGSIDFQNEESKAAHFKKTQFHIVQHFAVGAEQEAGGYVNEEIIAKTAGVVAAQIADVIQNQTADGNTEFARILRDPGFVIPDIHFIAKALDGIWLHSAKLNAYAATIPAGTSRPANDPGQKPA